jgi:ABC-2 type transport system ATP-binding protein
LRDISGIITVNVNNDIFQIECSRDATTEIARTIVESGAGLNFLNKKEYGLDDIYYRYFEGGAQNE